MALAIDASTPAVAVNSTGATATVTTASFTPPSNSVLLIRWAANSKTGANPTAPTITDNLGVHLTYNLLDFASRADATFQDGQCAQWWALVSSSAAMTITVTNGAASPDREAALSVAVFTGANTSAPVGAHGKGNPASGTSTIAQSYTATADNSWGFIGVSDWDEKGAMTGGTGCTVSGASNGSANIGSAITYGFLSRTTADGVNGNSTTLNVTLGGSSANLHWVYAEVIPAAGAATGPAFYPKNQAVRAKSPQPQAYRSGLVYGGLSPNSADTSLGSGRISWNYGAPVVNPHQGPAFRQGTSPVRARIPQNRAGGTFGGYGPANGDTSYGSGRAMWNAGAPVRNPAPGPVFRQKPAPIRFILPPWQPRAGRIGSSFGAPVANPRRGPPAYAPEGPVRARIPQLQPRAGRVASSPGGPVRNPAPGPAFTQRTSPASARNPLPARGRAYATARFPAAVVPPPAGPAFIPADQAARARLPLQPFLHGRSASNAGAPARNPSQGPVFRQATAPARTRPALPLKGRIASGPGGPVPALPVTGPVFTQRTAARAALPLPRRGTCRAIRSYPVPANPATGPAFTPAAAPARARISLPPRGRVASNPGGPVRNPAPGNTGPVFFPFRFPARSRIIPPRRGRAAGSPGGPVQNPAFPQQPGVIVIQWRPAPSRARVGPAGLPGAGVQFPPATPQAGPVFRPATRPSRAPVPQVFSKGRASGNAGAPLRNPSQGAVFRQVPYPVRARNPLPLAGRVHSSPGGPVRNPSPAGIGPAFYPRNSARAQVPLPRRGTCRAIRFYPVPANPATGPVFIQAATPARARITQAAPRGTVSSNAGAPVQNPPPPVTGAVFYPRRDPARTRPALPPRGRVASSPGGPVRNPSQGPAFRQGTSPVRARFPLPPHGRVAPGNPGGPVRNPAPPTTGPAFTPAGTVRAKPAATPGRVYASPISKTAASSGGQAAWTAFAQPATPASLQSDTGSYTLGMQFTLSQPATLTGIWFYSAPGAAALPSACAIYLVLGGGTGSLVPGSLNSTPAWSGTAGSGWVRCPYIGGPALAAGSNYKVAAFYGGGSNWYSATSHYWDIGPGSGGITNGPVTAPSGGDGGQDTFDTSASLTYPATAFGAANYWVDVEVTVGSPQNRVAVAYATGRISASYGSPVVNPSQGPPFRQAVQAIRARRSPYPPPKGKVASNPGGPVRNIPNVVPVSGAMPWAILAALPVVMRGRTLVVRATPVRNPAPGPAFRQAAQPVRARLPFPPRGRVASNPGIPVAPAPRPAPVYPLHGPVVARRPLPPRGRVITGNPGAPVRNPHPGPVFRQAVHPARAVIPKNAPRGRTASNPGGPVENIPSGPSLYRLGSPFFQWDTGTPGLASEWDTGNPGFQWDTGVPETSS